jgi:positive regulator of sigma E activity
MFVRGGVAVLCPLGGTSRRSQPMALKAVPQVITVELYRQHQEPRELQATVDCRRCGNCRAVQATEGCGQQAVRVRATGRR